MNNTRLWIAGALILFALALVFAFAIGRSTAVTHLENEAGSAHSLRQQLNEARESLDDSRGQLQMLQTRHEVDRQALEMVRREIATLKEHAAELEESLGFYQSLMAPDAQSGGISAREPELIALEQAGEFAFRLVVQQEARKHELVQGGLELVVAGVKDSEAVSYSVQSLSNTLDEGVIELQFRYFQSVEGRLSLPEGFTPEEIVVSITVNRPRAASVEQVFDWTVQESFSSVGQ